MMTENHIEKMNRLGFYQRLFMETIDFEKFPWFRLILEKHLDEKDVEEVHLLMKCLEERKEDLREAKMLDLTPLLLHYVGMLNPQLSPLLTAKALQKQGYYQSLTSELLALMKSYPTTG